MTWWLNHSIWSVPGLNITWRPIPGKFNQITFTCLDNFHFITIILLSIIFQLNAIINFVAPKSRFTSTFPYFLTWHCWLMLIAWLVSYSTTSDWQTKPQCMTHVIWSESSIDLKIELLPSCESSDQACLQESSTSMSSRCIKQTHWVEIFQALICHPKL